MSITDLREMTVAGLENELLSLLKEQFNLRMQQASGQLNKPHLMYNVRKNIARIKTILTEKQVRTND